jgi:ferredoxin-NADP reductase
MRCFSIASSPNDRNLQFAMRLRGRFTKTAARLQRGNAVMLRGPFGNFVIDETQDRQVVMLAAGIGITPFISMARHAAEQQQHVPITLLFTNRSAQNIPFAEELQALAARNPYFRTLFFASRENGRAQSAGGARIISGSITQDYIKRLTEGTFRGSSYFICGPKRFIKPMRKSLRRRGVDEDHIVVESFTQTTKSFGAGAKVGIQTATYGLTGVSLLLMTCFIMFLDLSRNIQKGVVKAQTTTSTQTTSNKAATSPTQASSSTNTTTQTPAAASTQTQTQATPQQTPQYQQPVSSVS